MKLIYFRKPSVYYSIQKGNGKQREAIYLLCSPNSSTVVLASFCRASYDFPLSNLGHPPNMVTWVRPSPKLKAVAVCHNRGCAPSGRVSWGEIRSGITSLLEVNVHLTELVISWLVTMMTVNTIVYLGINFVWRLSQLNRSHIHHHSPPSTSQS